MNKLPDINIYKGFTPFFRFSAIFYLWKSVAKPLLAMLISRLFKTKVFNKLTYWALFANAISALESQVSLNQRFKNCLVNKKAQSILSQLLINVSNNTRRNAGKCAWRNERPVGVSARGNDKTQKRNANVHSLGSANLVVVVPVAINPGSSAIYDREDHHLPINKRQNQINIG